MTCGVHPAPHWRKGRGGETVVTHSSGALIASEVIVRGACVDEACSKFNRLARQIFPARPRRYTFVGQSWDLLSTWMADSRYDSGALDRALQEAFGPTRRLFDTTIPLVSGIRIALTASQVDDGSLCLFTNYRAAGRSTTWSAHSVLASNDEPLLWEVLVVTPSPSPHLLSPCTPYKPQSLAVKFADYRYHAVHDAVWPPWGMYSPCTYESAIKR